MDNKQTRILLIEPNASRREFIRSALTGISPDIEFQVLSDIQQCRHDLEASTSTMAFSPVEIGKTSAEAGEFFAKLSHDLRNRIGVILNSVYVLKKMGFDDQDFLQKYLEIIEQEAVSMNQTLSDRASEISK